MIYQILEEIAATNSRKEKERILKENEEVPHLIDVLRYAYNPFITFGITAPEQISKGSLPLEQHLSQLDLLANRDVTGNDATKLVSNILSSYTFEAGEIFKRILNKDLRCGISISTINKALGKGTVPDFNVMLAHKYDPKRVENWPVLVEPKLDGMRCLAKITPDNQVNFVSRNGKPITSISHLEADIKTLINNLWSEREHIVYLDGELTSGDNFNISISDLRKKDTKAENALFHVFDFIYCQELQKPDRTLPTHMNRQLTLQKLFDLSLEADVTGRVRPVVFKTCFSDEDIRQYYEEIRDQGGEGVIIKPTDSIYEPKRSYAWMKIKDQQSEDLKVVDILEGEGKYTGHMGKLVVDFNGVEVKVGTGFSDAEREALWKNPPIGRIAEVEYHEVTPDGSLRHPRFKGFRDDKE